MANFKVSAASVSLILIELAIIAFLLIEFGRKPIFLAEIKDVAFTDTGSELKYFYEPGKDKRSLTGAISGVNNITINSDQLNERFDYSTVKNENVFRIAVLGDSFTFGYGVSTKDNYSEQLEDLLNERCRGDTKFEVINLGVPSYDIRYSVERFKIRGMKYEPDLLLWLLIRNDFTEINEFIIPYTRHNHRLEMSKRKSEKILSAEEREAINLELAAKLHIEALDRQNDFYGERGLFDYQEKALNSISEYYSGLLFLFTLGPGVAPIGDEPHTMLDRMAESRAMTHFYESGIDISGTLKVKGHPDKNGHKMIAEDIFRELRGRGLLSCI